MELKESYSIKPKFLYMFGVYDRNAKLCTLVKELNRTFIVDRSPLQILNDSIRCIGFNLRGAMETSKWHLGNIHMRPLMVDPSQRIVVFPDKSPKRPDTIWFNPNHIKRTLAVHLKTKVAFTNGSTITIPSKLYSFNNKLQIADQFMKMIENKGDDDSSSPWEDPQKRA